MSDSDFHVICPICGNTYIAILVVSWKGYSFKVKKHYVNNNGKKEICTGTGMIR